jgi:hypothetical protein
MPAAAEIGKRPQAGGDYLTRGCISGVCRHKGLPVAEADGEEGAGVLGDGGRMLGKPQFGAGHVTSPFNAPCSHFRPRRM